MSFSIVVVGYNRPQALNRLLTSLDKAYINEEVPLIISLDFCEDESCRKIADAFRWRFGEKIVVTHREKLGLKKHILECGSYTEKYNHVLILEDDLFVSPFFFSFIKATTDKYENDSRVAGIGLYNYPINRSNPYRFTPVDDGYDVYLMQSACSWGQVWTRNKWLDFLAWYQENDGPFYNAKGLPKCISDWDDKSWLKYYMRYCVEKDKYFVYPRIALVTDFSEQGIHAVESSNEFQIPLLLGEKKWDLPTFEQAKYTYNAFYENEMLYQYLFLPKEELLVDLYGVQESEIDKYSYWLSTKPAKFQIIKSFGLEMKPRDLNIIFDVPGDEIFLYDLSKSTTIIAHDFRYKEMVYHIGSVNTKSLFYFSIYNVCRRAKSKVVFYKRKILKRGKNGL